MSYNLVRVAYHTIAIGVLAIVLRVMANILIQPNVYVIFFERNTFIAAVEVGLIIMALSGIGLELYNILNGGEKQ